MGVFCIIEIQLLYVARYINSISVVRVRHDGALAFTNIEIKYIYKPRFFVPHGQSSYIQCIDIFYYLKFCRGRIKRAYIHIVNKVCIHKLHRPLKS